MLQPQVAITHFSYSFLIRSLNSWDTKKDKVSLVLSFIYLFFILSREDDVEFFLGQQILAESDKVKLNNPFHLFCWFLLRHRGTDLIDIFYLFLIAEFTGCVLIIKQVHQQQKHCFFFMWGIPVNMSAAFEAFWISITSKLNTFFKGREHFIKDTPEASQSSTYGQLIHFFLFFFARLNVPVYQSTQRGSSSPTTLTVVRAAAVPPLSNLMILHWSLQWGQQHTWL